MPWPNDITGVNLTASKKLKRSDLSSKEIQLIKGIGPVLSREIIISKKPLKEIKGIGEYRLKHLSYYIEE
jgi:hypothetical protein